MIPQWYRHPGLPSLNKGIQLIMTLPLGNNASLRCKKFVFANLILEGGIIPCLFKADFQIYVTFPRASSYYWPTQDYNSDFWSPPGTYKTLGSPLLLMKVLNSDVCPGPH